MPLWEVPDHLDDGWDSADLAEMGIDKEKISPFMNRIAQGKHDEIHSILIVKDGKLVLEEYFSPNWIDESTRQRIEVKNLFWGWKYGYHWMQVDVNLNDKTIHSYFVPGDGGQLLAVFPDLDMVIVFTAGNYGTDVKTVCFSMIYKYILPAVQTLK